LLYGLASLHFGLDVFAKCNFARRLNKRH
jgi:hypothetical protein